MEKPFKYTKIKVLKITDVLHQTLEKLRNRKVNVAQFIMDANRQFNALNNNLKKAERYKKRIETIL